MLNDLKVSAFLAVRAIKRGGRAGFVLNILIIAMVFMNMILLSSIISGSVNLFYEQTIDYETSDVIVKPGEDKRVISSADELVNKINGIPGVRRASPHYSLGATLSNEDKSISIPVTAIKPRDETEVTKVSETVVQGNYLGSGDLDEIIIGFQVAGNEDERKDFFDSLGGAEVGDTIEVAFANGVIKDYRIKGIFQTKSWTVDLTAFVSWDEMNSVLGYDNSEASEILVKSMKGHSPEEVKYSMLTFNVPDKIQTWEESMTGIIEDSLETFDIINNISLFVSLVIAIVVIFIVMMIKAINNKKQIAILKAIGIHKNIIVNSYVIQVLLISLIGIILGLIGIEAIIAYFTAHPMEFPDGNVTPYVETAVLIENAVMLTAVSCIAGYIPARRIAGENILEAMR